MEVVDLPVVFEASEVEKRVTIHTTEDSLVEGIEEFVAVLRPVSDRIAVTPDTLGISIEETTNGILIKGRQHKG